MAWARLWAGALIPLLYFPLCFCSLAPEHPHRVPVPQPRQVKLHCTRGRCRLLTALLRNTPKCPFYRVATGPAVTNDTFDFHLLPVVEPEQFGKESALISRSRTGRASTASSASPFLGLREAAGSAPALAFPAGRRRLGQPGLCQQGEVKFGGRGCTGQGQSQREQRETSSLFKHELFLLKFAFFLPSN